MPTRPATHRPRRTPVPEDRPSAARRGYGRRWRAYRLEYLAAHPLCVACLALAPARLTPATDVDHVRAVAGPEDPTFFDAAGHQALCHAHHSAKTAREDGGMGRAKDPR